MKRYKRTILLLLLALATVLPYQLIAQAQSSNHEQTPSRVASTFSNLPIDYRYRMIHDVKNEVATYAIAEKSHLEKKTIIRMLVQVAEKYEIEPALLVAIATQESMLDTNARSHMGALGLMQLMPATARRFGVKNIFDPRQNAEGGARYVRFLLNEFNGTIELVLAAYNAGSAPVLQYKAIPPFAQTQTFVERVLKLRDHYRQVL